MTTIVAYAPFFPSCRQSTRVLSPEAGNGGDVCGASTGASSALGFFPPGCVAHASSRLFLHQCRVRNSRRHALSIIWVKQENF